MFGILESVRMHIDNIRTTIIKAVLSGYYVKTGIMLDYRKYVIRCLENDGNADRLFLMEQPTLEDDFTFFLHMTFGKYFLAAGFSLHQNSVRKRDYIVDLVVNRSVFPDNDLAALCGEENLLVTETGEYVVTDEGLTIRV
jgi:hypothetical protein